MANDRGTCWSVTINNPTSSDEEYIAIARQKGWKVEGQHEKGLSGTPHCQLMVRTPQVRFSAVKKAFPRAHIELARNQAALATYVHKEETRIGELVNQQESYPSLSKFWELIFKEPFDWKNNVVNGNYIEMKDRQSILTNRFDDRVSNLIREGYVVETIAMNPSTRGSFLRYGRAIEERTRRQLSRQTEQNVVVPTIPNVEEESDEEEGSVSSEGSSASWASDASPF